jgi:transcription elongation factor GreA
MEKVPMTPEGLVKLQEELKRLKSEERPAVIAAIEEARAHGDLSENAEYDAAKDRQAFIEGRIGELEDKISRAAVIDISKLSGDDVKFGATVTLEDEDTEKKIKYQIVGVEESDISKGLLSIHAPLARALIGKSKNDTVEVKAPGGDKMYRITKVEYKV